MHSSTHLTAFTLVSLKLVGFGDCERGKPKGMTSLDEWVNGQMNIRESRKGSNLIRVGTFKMGSWGWG